MTQEAIKTRKQAKQTAMIVSRVASESIRNMNETKDSKKKTETKNMQNHQTTTKYVGYDENKQE